MANQEGVDIIIKATDQYTKTINNIRASNELFGESLKNTEKEIAAITKLMITMRAQGIDPTDAAMVKLKEDYDRLNASLESGEGTLKSSNKQWTALSLVVQDLPYGFRGIQNNLPALLGSIAGVGGAAYFAFSALVAVYTAYGDQINDAIFKTGTLEKATNELGKANTEAAKSTETARTELLKVGSVIEAAKNGYISKTAAIEYYNEKLGDSFGKVSSLGEAEQALIDKTPDYIEALMLKAKAELYFAKAAEYSAKKDVAMLTDQLTFFDKLYYAAKAITTNLSVGAKGVIKAYTKGLVGAQSSAATIVEQTSSEISDVLTKEGKAAMTSYFEALKKSGLSDAEIQSIIDKLNQKLLKNQEKTDKELQQALEKAQNVQISNYIDTLSDKNAEIVKSELKLQEDIAALNAAGFEDITNALLANKIRVEEINKKYIDKDIDQIHKGQQFIKKIIDDYNKDKIDGQVKYTNDYIKSLDAQLKAELRLHRGNINLQQEDIKSKINQLKFAQVFAAGNVKATQEINAALQSLNGTLTGVGTNWANTANRIVSIANDFLANSFVSLGETIGQALAGEKVQPFVALAGILADALTQLGQALISFAILEGAAFEALKNPASWPIALAAGTAAVAAGAFLKSKLKGNNDTSSKGGPMRFANGGIISGPTMGLMGEYPGAASNPEVVAPLDKLKDLIGGDGGGTFVLRGQDLLLSVNRAQKASNLKGQNISLA
jgi:hypothetical protein